MTKDKAISNADKIVHNIRFWKESPTIQKREIRKIIRNNYKAAISMFNGFFGQVRVSHGDVMDENTMTIIKLVDGIDRVQYQKAISVLKQHGFRLSVYKLNDGKVKVVMAPGDAIASFKTISYVQPDKIDYSLVMDKLKLLH